MRYRAATQDLTLVSWNSGTTLQSLATNFNGSFENFAWSPDCHYLVGILTSSGPKQTLPQITIWDVNINKRIGMLSASRPRYPLNWSPDNNSLVIQTAQGGYLWYLPTNRQTLLNPQADSSQRNFYRLEWDTQRNELLAVQVGSANGVTAYRLADGQRSGFFYVLRQGALVNYRTFENGQFMLVYETADENFWSYPKSGPLTFALWNRTTQANVQLKAGDLTPPDGFDTVGDMNSRFFILNIHSGDPNSASFYVWDLRNPVGSPPYVPFFWRTTEYGADGIRFYNDHTLEVADWTYYANPIDMRIRRFDLNTGGTLLEIKNIPYERCLDGSLQKLPEHALLEWGCQLPDQNDRTLAVIEGSPPINGSTYYWPR